MKKKNIFILLFCIFCQPHLFAQETGEQEEETEQEIVMEETPEVSLDPPRVIHKRDTTEHELHVNILNVLVFGALDVAYERILTDHSSVSAELFSKVFNKNEGEDGDLSKIYTKDFSITGKFKYFIDDEKVARGYYANLFGMFSNGEKERNMELENSQTGELETRKVPMEYTDLAFGIGVGGKFVTKQGFLIDASFGIGRNLFDRYSPDIVILPSVYIGYRF